MDKSATTCVQPELILPGEAALPYSGEMSPRDRADMVAEATRSCPAMAGLSDEERRWVVVQAFSDSSRLSVAAMSAIAGISERTAYRLKAREDIRSAVAEVTLRMAPPGFVMLRGVAEDCAARLANDLRTGKKLVGSLAGAEQSLLSMAIGGAGGRGGAAATVTTPDGTVVSLEATASAVAGGDDRIDQARSKLRGRLVGSLGGSPERGGCQSLPDPLPGMENGGELAEEEGLEEGDGE